MAGNHGNILRKSIGLSLNEPRPLNCGKQRTYISHICFYLSFADANLCSNCIWGELICYALLTEFIFVRRL